jgi:catechol 2,3-dioxygenase-like lactoylglutathione lyase family enzyme
MERVENRAKLLGIDGVYIPVTNRKKSEEWYVEHLGMERGGDYLLAGRQEIFLRERLDEQVLSFQTNQWFANGESYVMPFVCFRTSDVDALYEHIRTLGVSVGELIVHSWFKEFDFCDPDGNKLKVWQPNE